MVAAGVQRGSRIALALVATLSLGGCAIYGTELTSVATFGPDALVVYECSRSDVHFVPPSGARRCFSIQGIRIEVEVDNREPVAGAIGPLPLIPFFHPGGTNTLPLKVHLGFEPSAPHAFAPWNASLETDQGETVGVTGVSMNVRDGSGVHTVALETRDAEARTLEANRWSRFSLTFGRHIPPEQSFALTIQLRAPDGTEVRVPVRFKKGKVSYLGSIP
jgi:hypothetical protein